MSTRLPNYEWHAPTVVAMPPPCDIILSALNIGPYSSLNQYLQPQKMHLVDLEIQAQRTNILCRYSISIDTSQWCCLLNQTLMNMNSSERQRCCSARAQAVPPPFEKQQITGRWRDPNLPWLWNPERGACFFYIWCTFFKFVFQAHWPNNYRISGSNIQDMQAENPAVM